MVAVRLEDDALEYVAGKLAEAGGLAGYFRRASLWEPVVFLPDFADPNLLPDFEQGGVATQAGADAEIVSYIHYLKKRNGRLHSLIFDDPWSKPGDMDYAGPPPEELITLDGRIAYLHGLAALEPDLIWNYRAVTVSFAKLIYVCELTVHDIGELLEGEPEDLMETLAASVRHIAVNAYDDETWITVRHDGG